jgi:OmpA-OmpF porin, OOP family
MKKCKLITSLSGAAGALALFAAAPYAHAQLTNVMDESTGFYLGAGGGQADPDDADKNSTWKVYGGWQVNKWLSAELAYMDFGNSGYHGTGPGGVPYSGSIETYAVSLDAVGMFPVPIGALDKFSILGRIGAAYYNRDDDTPFAGFNPREDDGVAFHWGFGAQYTFSEHIGVRAEWERFEKIDTDAWTVSLNYKF